MLNPHPSESLKLGIWITGMVHKSGIVAFRALVYLIGSRLCFRLQNVEVSDTAGDGADERADARASFEALEIRQSGSAN